MVKSRQKKSRKFLWWSLAIFMLLAAVAGAGAWWVFYSHNLVLAKSTEILYVHTGSTIAQVEEQLSPRLSSLQSFRQACRFMHYQQVKPGKYLLQHGMSNHQLVNMLRQGRQQPVRLVIRSYNLPEDLAHSVAKNLEADSSSLVQLMTDSALLADFGISPAFALGMVIPDTYEFWWNTPAREVFARLLAEYKKFWTADRKTKARQHGLSENECITLASIVARETNFRPEMPIIAGVYLNRIAKGMPLQADPTVKFAIGNFTLKRILNAHLEVESPYNTYKVAGLPPGPICNPVPEAVDAVLNAKNHSYIYFCAKEDFSGSHNFATTLKEHNENAKKFHRALNKRGVR